MNATHSCFVSQDLFQAKTRGNFIPPISLARHVKMNKKQQVSLVGSKELLGKQTCEVEYNEENYCPTSPVWLRENYYHTILICPYDRCTRYDFSNVGRQGLNENESSGTHEDAEKQKDDQESTMVETIWRAMISVHNLEEELNLKMHLLMMFMMNP